MMKGEDPMGKRVLDKDRYRFIEKPPVSLYSEELEKKRAEEIPLYLKTLSTYGISSGALVKTLLSREERILMLNLALILLSEEKLWSKTKVQKVLPLKVFSKLVEEPLFELKRMEKPLLAMALLLEKDAFKELSKHLHYELVTNEKTSFLDTKEDAGIALKKTLTGTFVLTSDGAFLHLREKAPDLGVFIYGKRKKKKPNLLKPLVAVILLVASLGILYQNFSQEIQRTVTVKAVGQVTLTFNSFGQLVEASGNNAPGQFFLSRADFEEKDLDTVLAEIIEQAYITETIKERSTVEILISGKPLEKTFFHQGKTRDRLLSYQLDVKINDNGSSLRVE